MKSILIVASTPMELSLLTCALNATPVEGVRHLKLLRGEAAGHELLLAVSGIGKVNAALAAALLLDRFRPELMINIGCGGAFVGCGLSVGDLAVATSEVCADEGVETPTGWRGLDLIGIPVLVDGEKRLFNEIPLATDWADRAFACAEAHGFRAQAGRFLTVSTCSGTALHGAELQRRFPGICENMEGAALAQVARIFATPFLELRGISNLVEDRDLSRWDLPLAVAQAQNFVLRFLATLHGA